LTDKELKCQTVQTEQPPKNTVEKEVNTTVTGEIELQVPVSQRSASSGSSGAMKTIII